MKYTRFEWLIVAAGGAAVVGTLATSLRGRPLVAEVVAQLLLLVVIFGAAHWGRNGGFFAAVGATLAYIAMWAPMLVREGITPDLLNLVIIRAVTYGFVGIVGGEVCGRIKYTLAKLGNSGSVDDATQVYNGAFLGRIISTNLGQHGRYRTPFSLVLVSLAPALTSELKPSRQRSLLRAVANHLRNDVRLVDDVGRLDDGTFVLVLPQTPKDGAKVAAGRVRVGVRELLGARDESVNAVALGAPEDIGEIRALCDDLDGQSAVQASAS